MQLGLGTAALALCNNNNNNNNYSIAGTGLSRGGNDARTIAKRSYLRVRMSIYHEFTLCV